MPIWGWIILVVLLFTAYRILTRKWLNARKVRKGNRRRASVHHKQARKTSKYRRRTGRRGTITPVAWCQEVHNGQVCGLPVSKCRAMQRDAEHAAGMLGPRKKK